MGLKEGPAGSPSWSPPSWPVLLLAAVTISLSAVSLSQLLALRADVNALRSQLRREEQQELSTQVSSTGSLLDP